MYLLLSHDDDPVAAWIYQNLSGVLDGEMIWLRDADFGAAWRFELRLGEAINEARIALADGRRIDSSSVDAVLNRLNRPVGNPIYKLSPEDREYAWQEMAAFTLSWLSAFDCPVYNAPAPNGFAGRSRSMLEWKSLALKAGLPVSEREYNARSSTRGFGVMQMEPLVYGEEIASVIVIGSSVVSAETELGFVFENYRDASVRLAELSEMPLLEIVFKKLGNGEWTFRHISPQPDLQSVGYRGLEVLRELLSHSSLNLVPLEQ